MNELSESRKPLVLVADDSAAMREFCRLAIEQAGFNVALAQGGQEAIELFSRLKPDMILLDVIMPDMDGFATCREIRGIPYGSEIPILMVTGLDDTESIQKAFDAGATDFITKPINDIVLGHRLRYVLRSYNFV